MARVHGNWERLVRATLRREQLRSSGPGHRRTPSGIAGAIPPSLERATNIDAILHAADEIQSENPNVARIRKHCLPFQLQFWWICFFCLFVCFWFWLVNWVEELKLSWRRSWLNCFLRFTKRFVEFVFIYLLFVVILVRLYGWMSLIKI